MKPYNNQGNESYVMNMLLEEKLYSVLDIQINLLKQKVLQGSADGKAYRYHSALHQLQHLRQSLLDSQSHLTREELVFSLQFTLRMIEFYS